MSLLLTNIVLALAWAGFTGRFDPGNLTVGFLLGYLTLWLGREAFATSTYFKKVPQVLGFFLFFLWELIIANLRVARRVLSPLSSLRPRVIAVPLDTCNEIEITILASLISLTPGTLSVEASNEPGIIYVHAMDAPDPEKMRRDIKHLIERRVLNLTRGSSDATYQSDQRKDCP